MHADYRNWVPLGLVYATFGGSLILAVVAGVMLGTGCAANHLWCLILTILCFIGFGLTLAFGIWCILARKAFDYNGERQLSTQMVNGIADKVKLPAGGTCLDVGCGSGALTIAVAKRNPQATVVGLDRWGKEYKSFSQPLCEQNAIAEGVSDNTKFVQGDAKSLDFPDETFDAVVSNYVYHNIPHADRQKLLKETLRVLKDGGTFALHDIMSRERYGDMQKFCDELLKMGFQSVELIDTTDGMFMTPKEASVLFLKGSTLLYGIK